MPRAEREGGAARRRHRHPPPSARDALSTVALRPAVRPTSAPAKWVIGGLLVALTLGVFWPVSTHDFTNYDDDVYVMDNYHVRRGMTAEGAAWALTSADVNWHPLTWMSHMLDCQLFGLRPGPHHVVNVLLHAANTLLLFLALARMTSAPWRSAFVAALFAVHPLHVESVAWVAERKDVLSTCFWMLTLLAYTRYVQRPSVARNLLVACTLALGLLSKPMLVTVPFVLLLLDYWPLRRLQSGSLRRLIVEKLPLLVLVVAASAVTVIAQTQMRAVGALQVLPLSQRVANALVAYVAYLAAAVWPSGLAVFYPHPRDTLAAWQVMGAAVLLGAISFLVMRSARSRPYLAVGWLWYVGTLVPVIGLVQVGRQAMADRYTYVPLIGIFIMVAWGVPELIAGWARSAVALRTAAAATIGALAVCTVLQLGHWKNSVALFEHALAVTRNNYLAHGNLGQAFAEQGRFAEAIPHYQEALRLAPDDTVVRRNLGAALDQQGRIPEALEYLTEAVRLNPHDAKAHSNLGSVLSKLETPADFVSEFTTALRLDPYSQKAHNNLGEALIRHGRAAEAIPPLTTALRLKPDYPEAHNNLGVALATQGRLADAIAQFSEALRLRPDYPGARRNLTLAVEQQRGQ